MASRTRSILAAGPNINVPISTERMPPSKYSSAARATPGNCWRNLRQERTSIQVDGMSTGRLNNRDTALSNVISEISSGGDAIAEIVFCQGFLKAYGHRF